MRRLALLVLLCGVPASAHFLPGERSVVVQAEEDAIALLVTYRPSSMTPIPLRPNAPRELLKSVLAARAVSILDAKLDAARLPDAEMQVKLVEDPPGSGRPLVIVLVSATVPPGAHTLTLEVGEDAEPTATRWIDRSNGRVRVHGPRAAGVSFQDRGRLVLGWR